MNEVQRCHNCNSIYGGFYVDFSVWRQLDNKFDIVLYSLLSTVMRLQLVLVSMFLVLFSILGMTGYKKIFDNSNMSMHSIWSVFLVHKRH